MEGGKEEREYIHTLHARARLALCTLSLSVHAVGPRAWVVGAAQTLPATTLHYPARQVSDHHPGRRTRPQSRPPLAAHPHRMQAGGVGQGMQRAREVTSCPP